MLIAARWLALRLLLGLFWGNLGEEHLPRCSGDQIPRDITSQQRAE